ncbi:hypothetical protein FKM82_010974, partial [Ascaphus truei]
FCRHHLCFVQCRGSYSCAGEGDTVENGTQTSTHLYTSQSEQCELLYTICSAVFSCTKYRTRSKVQCRHLKIGP